MSTMEQALPKLPAWCIQPDADAPGLYLQCETLAQRDAIVAALTAALPAQGVEAPGDWVMVPRVSSGAMDGTGMKYLREWPMDASGCYEAMLAAAPSAPAEISQAQAQAMREALEKIEEMPHDWGEESVEMRQIARAALTPEPPR